MLVTVLVQGFFFFTDKEDFFYTLTVQNTFTDKRILQEEKCTTASLLLILLLHYTCRYLYVTLTTKKRGRYITVYQDKGQGVDNGVQPYKHAGRANYTITVAH